MPLNDYSAFTLTPNTNSNDTTPVTTTPVTLASISLNVTGSTDVVLDATVGWRVAPGTGQDFIFRIREGNALTGRLLYRSRQSGEAFYDEFQTTSFSHVITSPGTGTKTYYLTVQASTATPGPSTVIGPITLAGAAIS